MLPSAASTFRIILATNRIEAGLAAHAPARMPLQQVDAMEVLGFAHQPPLAAILPAVAQARDGGRAVP
jgi:hypothetical protein